MSPLTDSQLAACLEHEWAHVLYPDECLDPVGGLGGFHAGAPPFLPTAFHGEVAGWMMDAFGSDSGAIQKVREIGGGTGAFAREFLRRHPACTFVMIDLAVEKIRHARRLLLDQGKVPGYPVLGADFSITHRPLPEGIPWMPEGIGGLEVIHGDGARFPDPVDLVVSLNVIDRVSDPRRFVADLAGQVREGGWLALSSPLDWLDGITPPANRVLDLADLVPSDWEIAARGDFRFPFRSHPRRTVVFLAGALLLRRIV